MAVLTVSTGYQTYFSDSEIWAISVAKLLGSGQSTSIFYKLPFYVVLKILYWFPLDNVGHLLAARLIFAVIGVLILVSYYFLCRRLFANRSVALFLTFCLQTSSFFI